MKLEDIRISTVIHSLAAVTLLGTIALFTYEASKPAVALAHRGDRGVKQSALAVQASVPELLHRLPALPERFQRKVLYCGVKNYYGVKKRWWWPGKNSTNPVQAGKVYSGNSTRNAADDE